VIIIRNREKIEKGVKMIKKGDIVKIKNERLLDSFKYLKDRRWKILGISRRGNEYYVTLDKGLYINIKALEKIK